jgi:hypothetical protein
MTKRKTIKKSGRKRNIKRRQTKRRQTKRRQTKRRQTKRRRIRKNMRASMRASMTPSTSTRSGDDLLDLDRVVGGVKGLELEPELHEITCFDVMTLGPRAIQEYLQENPYNFIIIPPYGDWECINIQNIQTQHRITGEERPDLAHKQPYYKKWYECSEFFDSLEELPGPEILPEKIDTKISYIKIGSANFLVVYDTLPPAQVALATRIFKLNKFKQVKSIIASDIIDSENWEMIEWEGTEHCQSHTDQMTYNLEPIDLARYGDRHTECSQAEEKVWKLIRDIRRAKDDGSFEGQNKKDLSRKIDRAKVEYKTKCAGEWPADIENKKKKRIVHLEKKKFRTERHVEGVRQAEERRSRLGWRNYPPPINPDLELEPEPESDLEPEPEPDPDLDLVVGDVTGLELETELEHISESSEKIILFLTLDPRLNDQVITRHEDLPKVMAQKYGTEAKIDEREFGFDKSIIDILSEFQKHSISHLVIVTHGGQKTLYCGNKPDITYPSEEFDRLCKLLNEVLQPQSSILITACLTGKIEEEEIIKPLTLEIHSNCEYDNFSNKLAERCQGHKIFCTPDEQIPGEIAIYEAPYDPKFFRNDTGAIGGEIIYFSDIQIMYAFIHNDDTVSGCQTYIKKPGE